MGEAKRPWRFWHTHLAGIRREEWQALRRENRIDLRYRHRAAYLGLISFQNSILGRKEEAEWGSRIAQTELRDPPLFVLGHWRSGTTHLHYLLSQDEQFAWPSSFQVVFPHIFLTGQEAMRDRFRRFPALAPPATRPMDNVHISSDTPQEDEFALNNASLVSPYIGAFSFPRRRAHYDRFLTLDEATPEERQRWKETFRWYARKLTAHYDRPLLLKSPTHTARVRRLLELFPNARFVHIHRSPYDVFRSMRHLLEALPPKDYLQRPSEDSNDWIFRNHVTMFDALLRDRAQVPAGRYHEVAYADLVRDPLREVAAIYEALNLDGFDRLQPKLRAYVDSLSGYRQNRFPELSPTLRDRINHEWSRTFEAWGYSRQV